MRHHVSLQLRHEIHHHHHHNQQGRTTEMKRHPLRRHQNLGQQAHCRDIQSAPQSQARQHLIDVLGRLLSGADARDERTGLLQDCPLVSRALKTKRGIEEAEEDDEQSVNYKVQRLAIAQRLRPCSA